ncbi:hypothetical protein J2739_005500 [Variovorax soli]|uniref:Uncharacterized protein n=1 Tax=Variovorax soli TaxID=376815 RepID=A0ABU1NMY0_9BURK|nr:hypothetical protein [Variovorax soli]
MRTVSFDTENKSTPCRKSDEAGIYSLLHDEGPKLYGARIKSALDNELRIVSLEKVEAPGYFRSGIARS